MIKDIEVNVAYRWFLHLNLTDKVPHHSTISQNRRRRFNDTDVFREIFDDLVLLACERGSIEGKVLYTDTTHLKANANKKKFTRKIVAQGTRAYLDELEQAVNEDREDNGKKPFQPDEPSDPGTKEIKVSTTDPESGYMSRTNKPEGFFYLDHRTTDDKHNLITDVFVTPGNASDSVVYLERLDHQMKRFGFEVEAVGLDAGYSTPHICESLVRRNIFGVISYHNPGGKKGTIRKSQFTYNPESDCYICPQGNILRYYTTSRAGFREYIFRSPAMCNLPASA